VTKAKNLDANKNLSDALQSNVIADLCAERKLLFVLGNPEAETNIPSTMLDSSYLKSDEHKRANKWKEDNIASIKKWMKAADGRMTDQEIDHKINVRFIINFISFFPPPSPPILFIGKLISAWSLEFFLLVIFHLFCSCRARSL